ncbi:hypothetical protein BH10CYA1_BH10CYA1_18200 [soil metagenome]
MPEANEVFAVMTALKAAIAATEEAYSEQDKRTPVVNGAFYAIDPTRWTQRIESAIERPDQLTRIRTEFDELTLTFISAMLAYRNANRQVLDTYTALNEGIRAIVKVIDAPESFRRTRPLKAAMQALAVRAITTHRSQRAEVNINVADALGDYSRGYNILVAAFNTLATNLVKLVNHQTPHYMALSRTRKLRPYLTNDIGFRAVYRVPFTDCVGSTHPYNVRLVEAHIAIEQSLTNFRKLTAKLRGEQAGQVNELQHSWQMLELLHGAPEGYGGNLETRVRAQNKRRVLYEITRMQILLAFDELQARYEELLTALVDAGAETATLLAQTQAEGTVANDRKNTVRIAMNNCLAADSCLRRIVRDITEYTKFQANDSTFGNGIQALDAAYEESAKRYRSSRL